VIFGTLISRLDVREDGFSDNCSQGRGRRPREKRGTAIQHLFLIGIEIAVLKRRDDTFVPEQA
jgi:hypothetical protein